MIKRLSVILALILFSPVITSCIAAPIVFKTNETQMVFDKSTVKSAKVVVPEKASDDYGLEIKLKPAAANKLGQMTALGIGNKAYIYTDGKIVSSPVIQGKLGDEFIISGLTKDQANQFVNSLR